MNLKDFALLKENDDSYTVGHPQGKSITVSKKGLSEKAHNLIRNILAKQAYSQGGQVAPEKKEESWAKKAGSALHDLVTYERKEPRPELPPDPVLGAIKDFGQAFLKGGQESQVKVPEVEIKEEVKLPEKPVEQALSGEQAQSQAQAQQNPQKDYYESANESLMQAKREAQDLSQVQKGIGKELGESYDKYSKMLSNMETPDVIAKRYQEKDDAFQKEFEKKNLDPNRYYKNMDTGSKIASGLALVLSGFGSALAGQDNLAMKFINDAIERDIDAQKNDQGKTLTLWKMNRERLKSDLDANLATQNQYLNMVKATALKAQAVSQSATAQERLMQLTLSIDQQIAQNNWMRSRTSGGASGTEQDYVNDLSMMERLNPTLGKQMRENYIPNRGHTRKAPTEKNLQVLEAVDNFKQLAKDAEHFLDTVGRTGWGTDANAKAEVIRTGLYDALPALRGIPAGSDAKLDMFSKLIDSPGSLRQDKVRSQLEELVRDAEVRERSVYNQLGLVPFKKAPIDQAAIQWARNPQSPGWNQEKAKKILEVNGIK